MSEIKEECGVAACYYFGSQQAQANAAPQVVRALLDMQNRGQLSAGLTSYNPSNHHILSTHKENGSVQQVFSLYNHNKSKALMQQLKGFAAIGHNRYNTSGKNRPEDAQPFERIHGRKWKWFSVAFNGNLANYQQLKTELEDKDYHISSETDTEVMMHCINRQLRGEHKPSLANLFSSLAQEFDGAYNIAFINAEGELVAARDPLGFKPFSYAVKDNMLLVASENIVHRNLNMHDIRTLHPGEMLIANPQGWRIERYAPAGKPSPCFFEWVYFSNLGSAIGETSVYQARTNIGCELALQEKEQLAGKPPLGKMVICVPETSSTAANAFAYHMGLPIEQGLLRNRYVGRTFIEGANRAETVKMKFIPLAELLQGHSIYLVDDSLVRGTTLRTVIENLREQGKVESVHVRIGAPPVRSPCYYGIDMPTRKELFASQFIPDNQQTPSPQQLKRMAKSLNADSLSYLPIPRLCSALQLPPEKLCLACVGGPYPTPAGQKRQQQLLQQSA